MASGHRAPRDVDGDGANERTLAVLVESFGATVVDALADGTYTVRRPGKDEGHSGTVGKVAPGRFLNFSSNWPPFSTERAYTHHDLLGLLGKRPKVTVPPADEKRSLLWKPAARVIAQPVHWLWPDRIALGSLVLLVGREGTGKGILSAWLSARITTGTLPGHLHGMPASVLWLSSEDSWATTLKPRLMAAEADLERVGFLVTPDGLDALDYVPDHLDEVAEIIVERSVAFVVLDPLISVVPIRLDAYKEQHARAALKPLRDLGEQTGATVLGLTHFGKGHQGDAMTAVLNSRGFTAAARGVLVVGYDPEEEPPSTRIVRVEKSNLGHVTMPGWAYSIVAQVVGRNDEGYAISAGKLVERGEVPNPPSAEQMMRPGDRPSRAAVDDCEDFLVHYLGAEELLSTEVKAACEKEDERFTDKVLRSARERAGVEIRYEGQGKEHRTWWRLP
jgi:hypothetical protein